MVCFFLGKQITSKSLFTQSHYLLSSYCHFYHTLNSNKCIGVSRISSVLLNQYRSLFLSSTYNLFITLVKISRFMQTAIRSMFSILDFSGNASKVSALPAPSVLLGAGFLSYKCLSLQYKFPGVQ